MQLLVPSVVCISLASVCFRGPAVSCWNVFLAYSSSHRAVDCLSALAANYNVLVNRARVGFSWRRDGFILPSLWQTTDRETWEMKRLARGGCPLLYVTSDSRLAWTGGSPKTTSASSSPNMTSGSQDSQWKWHFPGCFSHYSVKTWLSCTEPHTTCRQKYIYQIY